MEPLASLGPLHAQPSSQISPSPSTASDRESSELRAPGKSRPVELAPDRVDSAEITSRSRRPTDLSQAESRNPALPEPQSRASLETSAPGFERAPTPGEPTGAERASAGTAGIERPESGATLPRSGADPATSASASGALADPGAPRGPNEAAAAPRDRNEPFPAERAEGASVPPNRAVTYSIHPELSVRFQGKVVDRTTAETIQSVPPQVQIEFMERFEEHIGQRLDVRG